jgi:hypothetical protein
MLENIIVPEQISTAKWWASRRLRYNLSLVVSGIIAFICYISILTIKSRLDTTNTDPEKYEFTLFTTLLQGVGYLIMIGLANLFYYLGPGVDWLFNKQHSERFRLRLFNIGFWFSCLLPFSIPVLVLIIV